MKMSNCASFLIKYTEQPRGLLDEDLWYDRATFGLSVRDITESEVQIKHENTSKSRCS